MVVDDVSKIEKHLERLAFDDHRTKPGRKDLAWKQIGILATIEDKQLPSLLLAFILSSINRW